MRITNPPAGHDDLSGVSTSDHHTKYSDSDARGAVVEDTAYEAGWNGDTTHAPSQNAVYDQLELVKVSDTAYADTWNGVTTIPPSKNAVYDKLETTARIATGTYTGDGSTSQAITGVGFQVRWLWITQHESNERDIGAGSREIVWTTDIVEDDNGAGMAVDLGNDSHRWVTDAVIALGADGFTVDDDANDRHPNKNAHAYNYFALG